MISPVDPMIESFVDAGADYHFTPPRSRAPSSPLAADHSRLRQEGRYRANPGNPGSVVDEVMDMVDLILVMSVNPGFGGQAFIESQLTKISALRTRIDNHVAARRTADRPGSRWRHRPQNSTPGHRRGANVLVAGTATFRGGPDAYADNIAAMRAG